MGWKNLNLEYREIIVITKELPRYRCHKEVWALKIKSVLRYDITYETKENDGSAVLHFFDDSYPPIRVSFDYVFKNNPFAGGYYVVHNDGYASWSSAEAFESGYTLIP